MPQFMIESIDINNVLKRSTFIKNIMISECQGIPTNAVIVGITQKLLCKRLICYLQTSRF